MILGDKLIKLMGYSIEHLELKTIFEKLKLVKRFDFGSGDFLERSYKSLFTPEEQFDIVIKSLNGKNFSATYDEPQFELNSERNEQILFEFSLDHQENKLSAKNISLPFELQYGDDSNTIIRKMGQKPNEKFSYAKFYTDDRHKEKNGYWFEFEKLKVLTALDAEFRLVWVRCTYLEKQVREARDLKMQLKQEKKNIKTDCRDSVAATLKHLPTKEWKKRMAEGDEMFSQEAIDDVESELKLFVEKLIGAAEKKNATTIHNTIKKTVLAINKLNIKYRNIIETLEREELCAFILDATKKTGFFANSNIDWTEEWRRW